MCSLLTFQVSRTNYLEQFYETTCRGEIFMYACEINVNKALFHCAIFSATCLAMVENVPLQVAEVWC